MTAIIRTCLGLALAVGITGHSIAESPQRTVEFSGWNWAVRRSNGLEGPGPNRFLDNSQTVWVDDEGHLHLKVWRRNDRAYAAEVILDRSLGYGTYIVETIGRMDNMDPSVIFGMFTYDDDPAHAHREIDIEYGRFGDPASPNAQFVLQPFEVEENRHRFVIRQEGDYMTHAFRWDEHKLQFASFHGHVAETVVRNGIDGVDEHLVASSWSFPGDPPPPGDERFRLNLWLYQSALPSRDHEVVLASFSFVPAAE